jgi:hypothetical protein
MIFHDDHVGPYPDVGRRAVDLAVTAGQGEQSRSEPYPEDDHPRGGPAEGRAGPAEGPDGPAEGSDAVPNGLSIT